MEEGVGGGGLTDLQDDSGLLMRVLFTKFWPSYLPNRRPIEEETQTVRQSYW